MTSRKSEPDPSTWAQATAATPVALHLLAVRRQRAGVLLGAGLGLSYGLVSQLINPLALPEVPLHQPPLGPLGNSLLEALVGALLGFLTTRSHSAALGILLGSVASAAAIMANALLRLGGLLDISSALVTGIIFSAPVAWLTVPVIALLRWVTDHQVEVYRAGAGVLARLRIPFVLMAIMAFLAAFELLPATARSELKQTHTLLQQGLAAPNGLPAALRGPQMRAFPPAGNRHYTLEWTNYDLDRFIELRPPTSCDQHAAVIAHFPDGHTIVCLYPTPESEPNCGTY